MVSRKVSSLLEGKVRLEVQSIDRMYLNAYQPMLQTPGGLVYFIREHLGLSVYSTTSIAPMTKRFVESIETFVRQHHVDVVDFKKGQRKEEIAKQYLRQFRGEEGVLFVGRAQEKTSVFRTEKRRDQVTGQVYPWLVRGTAVPNHYYFYLLDRDFGPLFIKFSSYFPYAAKVCLNGHEWLKRQLGRRGIRHEALDNGILSCSDPKALQRLADRLDAKRIDAVVRKWFARLPHPFNTRARKAGFRYALSILQAEFSLTQVLDRPLSGRQFFEEVIRENIDLGRPDHVQLIFNRKNTRRTPGLFRTCVVTHGVIPSLHINYKHSRIKQYFKEGRALRTETVINDTRDFGINRGLDNLSALREVGFQANRRLLDAQSLSHDCILGTDTFQSVVRPTVQHGQRASALKFGDERTQALMHALARFALLPEGFSNRSLREDIAPLLGLPAGTITPGKMTYDLRRLRLHGLIQRIPETHRYEVTQVGLRTAYFFSRLHDRVLRPALALRKPTTPPPSSGPLRRLEECLDRFLESTHVAVA